MADESDQVYCFNALFFHNLFRSFLTNLFSLHNTKLLTNKKENQLCVHLPSELEFEILKWLPTKALVRCRCVCKRWREEINNPCFIKSHTYHQQVSNTGSMIVFSQSNFRTPLSLNYHDSTKKGVYNKFAKELNFGKQINRVELVGSSNGLLCFRTLGNTRGNNAHNNIAWFVIVNPTNYSFYNISCMELKREGLDSLNMLGFGYDCVSDDYKILCSIKCSPSDYIYRISLYQYYVYSLKANSWKTIQPSLNVHAMSFSYMVLSNNALHCLAHNYCTKTDGIYGFDLATEEFHEVPQPNYNNSEKLTSLSPTTCVLANLKGCLHLAKYISPRTYKMVPRSEGDMTIWVMNTYGSKKSWTKLIHHISAKKLIQKSGLDYHHTHTYLPLPLAYSKDGLVILIGIAQGQLITKGFVRCDVRTGKLKKFKIRRLPYSFCTTGVERQVMPWTSSLIRLPSRS